MAADTYLDDRLGYEIEINLRPASDVSKTRTLQSCRMKATCSGLSRGLIGTNTPPAAGAPKLAMTVSNRFSR
jgi:hypothetical protein